MTTPVDDHTQEEVQMDGSSLYGSGSSQLDCLSETSYGSDFGDNDEHDFLSMLDNTDIGLDDSPPPVYSNEGRSPSTFLPANTDLKSSPVTLGHTPPTISLSSKPTRLNTKFLGPSMCVVCKISPAYNKGGVSYPTCGPTCASKMSDISTASPIFLPSAEPVKLNASSTGPPMCVICKLSPAYSKNGVSYPTCGLTCASKMPNINPNVRPVPSSASQSDTSYPVKQGSRSRDSVSEIKMCDVCHVRPRFQKGGNIHPTCGLTCAAILANNPSSKGDVTTNPKVPTSDQFIALYRKLSLLDHGHQSPQQPSYGYRSNSLGQRDHFRSNRGNTRTQSTTTRYKMSQNYQPCVVCRVNICRDGYVTCGMKCAETLCIQGSTNPRICDYCHRRPKVTGYDQCGKTCRNNASTACLLCKCRPRFGRYHLCGKTCKQIATKWTPLVLEARPGHTTYREVNRRFERAWKSSSTSCPPIKKIYKIIENKSFLLPYDRYKKRVGNEVFRYHGTSRACTLGSQGNTRLCSSTACALCSILRTSFKVSLANPSGAFGAGIYTSSAANKAYSYSHSGTGAVIVTKVVLGTIYTVQAWNQVNSCPPGHNSVVFDRQKGTLNETIVYTDDAIRPVFLIIF